MPVQTQPRPSRLLPRARTLLVVLVFQALALVVAGTAWAADPVTLSPPTTMDAHGATLNWSPYGGPFTVYDVHRSDSAQFSPSPGTRIASVSSQTTTYTDTSAQPETTYFYKIVAAGTLSNEQEVTLPPEGQRELVIYASGATFIHNYQVGPPEIPPPSFCANTGSAPFLHVTHQPTGGAGPHFSRTLLKFDTASLPGNTFYTDAVLQVWNQRPTASATVEAHRITQTWLEGTGPFQAQTCPTPDGATWNSPRPGFSWTTAGGDFDPTIEDAVEVLPTSLEHWDELDLGDLYVDWADAGLPNNYGVMLKQAVEPGIEGPIYASDEDPSAYKRPRLVISYYPDGPPPAGIPSELEDENGIPIGDEVANFGGYVYYKGWRTRIFGVRASIRNPNSDYVLPDRSLGTFRVSAQLDLEYQLQIGLTQSRRANCRHGNGGGRSHTTYAWEIFVAGQSLCHWLDNDPPYVYGDTNLFTVLRLATECPTDPYGPYFWEARINGVGKFCASMPTRRPFVVQGGGEVSAGSVRRDAEMSACYGCGTSTPWQLARETEGGWVNIVRRNIGRLGLARQNDTGNWQVGSLPRWSISNPG